MLNVAVYIGEISASTTLPDLTVYTRLLRTLSVCVLSITYVFCFIIKITSFHLLKVKQGNTSFKIYRPKGGLPLIT